MNDKVITIRPQELSKDYNPHPDTIVNADYDSGVISRARTVVRTQRHTVAPLEVKNYTNPVGGSFYDFLVGNASQNLAAYQALNYYSNVSVLNDAVQDIVKPAKKIPLVWYNDKKKDWVTEHESLDLLKNPGGGMSGELFKEFWLINKLVGGNAFVAATGFIKKPPLELLIGYAQDMNLQSDTKGYLWKILQSTQGQDVTTYTRDDLTGGNTFRYYSQNEQQEILVSRAFNTRFGVGNQWGMSPLKPLLFELEQFISQNMHNNSLLKRAATPSLIFSADGELDDKQYTKLNDRINDYYGGPNNAGRPILAESGMKVQAISQSNKDMQYIEAAQALSARIYNIYDIPLPTVMAQQMTLSNLESSRLMKFDDAVLPAIDEFCQEHTRLLQPRYRDLEGYELTYDPDSIEALEPRRLANASAVKELGVTSTNEIRTTYLKREPVGGEGDDILVSATMVPLGKDRHYGDEAENSPRAARRASGSADDPEGGGSEGADEGTIEDPDLEEDVKRVLLFVDSINKSLKYTHTASIKEAVKNGLFKSDDGSTNIRCFAEVVKRKLGSNEPQAIADAIEFGLFKDEEEKPNGI